MDIVVVWTLIVLLSVGLYVMLDGFDLGVGILSPFVKSGDERSWLMQSIAPIWDGNEVWMVMGGASLFAIFPLAYTYILSGLYQPIILMLVAMIFRGVSFEFRSRAEADRKIYWDLAFFLGSLLAAFFQGVVAGAIISGLPIEDGEYVGGALAWITPFNIMAGIGLILCYTLLGGTWLIKKLEGDLQARIRSITRCVALLFYAVSLLLLVWTIVMHLSEIPTWKIIGLIGIAIVALILGGFLARQLNQRGHDRAPFLISLGIVGIGAAGLVLTIWPYVLPFQFTIWEAAGPLTSLRFTLVGAIIFIPIVFIYTTYKYILFRGKISVEEEHK